MSLTINEITNICLKGFAGVKTNVELARCYGVSPKKIANIKSNYKYITDWLIKNNDDDYVLNSKLHAPCGNDEFPIVAIKGEFIYSKIEITRDLRDGIVICDSIWRNLPEDVDNISNITFGVDDRGQAVGKTKIGFLVVMDRNMVEPHNEHRKAPNGATLASDSMLVDSIFPKLNQASVTWYVSKFAERPDMHGLTRFSSAFGKQITKAYQKLEIGEKPLERIDLEFEVESEDENVKGVATLNPSAGTPPIVEISTNVDLSQPVPAREKPNYVWSASNSFIAISLGQETWNADSGHPEFRTALNHLFNDNVQGAVDLINVEKAVTKFVDGNINIENGVLKFNGYVLNNGLTNRILERMQNGEDFEFFIPFLNNLMENPSEKTVNRLFDFLEANDIEITEDGHFLAWKKVGGDFMDLFKGEFDNTPNGPNPPRMPRNQVDEDDTTTCSRGLHVCSKSYLGSYGSSIGNKIVVCKVHPRDVVAVPYDYNNAKMRTCGYTVIREATRDELN